MSSKDPRDLEWNTAATACAFAGADNTALQEKLKETGIGRSSRIAGGIIVRASDLGAIDAFRRGRGLPEIDTLGILPDCSVALLEPHKVQSSKPKTPENMTFTAVNLETVIGEEISKSNAERAAQQQLEQAPKHGQDR